MIQYDIHFQMRDFLTAIFKTCLVTFSLVSSFTRNPEASHRRQQRRHPPTRLFLGDNDERVFRKDEASGKFERDVNFESSKSAVMQPVDLGPSKMSFPVFFPIIARHPTIAYWQKNWSSRLLFYYLPTSHKHPFYDITRGFTRLNMKNKYVFFMA